MHELPITESILEIALRHARQNNAARITGINLVIGRLSSFVDESIQFYWDIVSDGTIAKGARLHFRRIPVRMLCHACLLEFSPTAGSLACPDCGSTRVKIITGEEFYVESIEIDQ